MLLFFTRCIPHLNCEVLMYNIILWDETNDVLVIRQGLGLVIDEDIADDSAIATSAAGQRIEEGRLREWGKKHILLYKCILYFRGPPPNLFHEAINRREG